MESPREGGLFLDGGAPDIPGLAGRDAKAGGSIGHRPTYSLPTLKSTFQPPTLAQNSSALPVGTSSTWSYQVLQNLASPLTPNTKLLQTIERQEKLRANYQEHHINKAATGNDAVISCKNTFPSAFPSMKPWVGPFEGGVHRSMKWGDGSQTGSEGSSIQQDHAGISKEHASIGGIHDYKPTYNGSSASLGNFDIQGYTPVGGSTYTGQYSHGHGNSVASGWNPRVPSPTPPLSIPGIRSSWQTSPNYKGNPCLPGNQSADIPEQESCSLWITNLNLSRKNPEHELLAHIKGCGKVYACVVNPPERNVGHTTSAAKVVFFHVSGARELLRQARAGEFVINGYVPKVVPNRIRTKSREPGPECRVIHIEGPKALVDECFLTLWFGSRFVFQTDEVATLSEDGGGPNGRRRLEWRFASYRCQASAAVQFIDKERRRGLGGLGQPSNLWRYVNTFYAVDPCA